MVLIDTDMIVYPLARRADRDARATGGWSRFAIVSSAAFAEWGELTGLGEARRGPYVVVGLVIARRRHGDAQVLELMHELQARGRLRAHVLAPKRARSTRSSTPTRTSSTRSSLQRRDPQQLDRARGAAGGHPAVPSASTLDTASIAVAAYADRTEPYVVHQFVRKPWLEPTYHGVYSQLLARLARRRRCRGRGFRTPGSRAAARRSASKR